MFVREWLRRARGAHRQDSTENVESFMFTWIAFNSWGECVADQERDSDWVYSLSVDRDLNERFAACLLRDPAGSDSAHRFRKYWPIPRVQQWRREPSRWPLSEHVLDRARFFHEEGIWHDPQCALRHLEGDEEIPLDWEHLVQAAYRVRCNLFHGDKSPSHADDVAIVRSVAEPLLGFMLSLDAFATGASC
jgi:hypothetical protein